MDKLTRYTFQSFRNTGLDLDCNEPTHTDLGSLVKSCDGEVIYVDELKRWIDEMIEERKQLGHASNGLEELKRRLG